MLEKMFKEKWFKERGFKSLTEQQKNSIIREIEQGEFIFSAGSITTFTTQEINRKGFSSEK